MAMQEDINFLLTELRNYGYYSEKLEWSKKLIVELQNDLKGLRSPRMDKVGSSGGFGIIDDTSKLVKFDKLDELKKRRSNIAEYIVHLYTITQSISDNSIKLYILTKYFEKKSTKEALESTPFSTKKRADEAMENTVGELIDKSPALIRNLKLKKESVDNTIALLK